MKKEKTVLLLAVALTLTGFVSQSALATINFMEDFESYADGSNLSGQGGWTGDTMYVGGGTYLSGSVLDGRDDIGTNTFSISKNGFGESLNASEITTLNFDGYATSTYPLTHSTSVGLDNISGGSAVVWSAIKAANGQFSWAFDARGVTGNSGYYQLITGGYNAAVSMSIVVDGTTGEVYGIYDYGSGNTGETAHYAVTDVQIEELNAVEIYVDYRSPTTSTPSGDRYIGGEFDNITVIPEPATLFLLGLGSLLLRRRRA